jgi:hypothetical protein
MNTYPNLRARKGRVFPLCVTLVLAMGVGAASAADRATCTVMAGLLNTIDRGLESTALGQASRSPTTGIATYASEAQEFAVQFSARDPLPQDVSAALTAIAEAASAHFFIADAAPALLEPGLIIQHTMPQICDEAEVPDLARHSSR